MESTVRFGGTDRAPLLADVYYPDGPPPHPLVLAISGGGWVRGDRRSLAAWGRYLARRGLALASVDYRRATEGPVFPGNAEDVATALEYVHARAAELGIDPGRIALLGVSAGAHLGALVTLSGAFRVPAPRALVGIYGVYDLMSHWQADLPRNSGPGTDKTERMIGCTPFDDPQRFHDGSPLRQITYERALPTFLAWGHRDQDVAPEQSAAFARALRQARYPVTVVELTDAAHLWFSEQDPDVAGGHSARIAPALVDFLARSLAAPV